MDPLHLRLATSQDSSTASSSSDVASLSDKSIRSMTQDSVDTITHCFQQNALSQSLTSVCELDDPLLTDTMFAHIHGNDASMVGSQYEGQVFTTSMQFAQGELDRLKSGVYNLGLSNVERNNIAHMSEELAHCQQTLHQIYRLATLNESEREKALLSIQECLITSIENLQPGQRLLLPGGWTGSPGHAMLYEIEKGADGALSFHLYNSGDGLSYHPSRCTDTEPPKTKYLCHLQWNLGHGASALAILRETLPDLLRLRASGKSGSWKSGVEQLYEGIIPAMQKRGANSQIAPRNDPSWSNIQKAGICTLEVIKKWERVRIPSTRRAPFFLCTKVRTLITYTNAQTQETLLTRGVIHHLALRSFSQLSKKLQEYGLGSDLLANTPFGLTTMSPMALSDVVADPALLKETTHSPIRHESFSSSSRLLAEPFIDYGKKEKAAHIELSTHRALPSKHPSKKRKKEPKARGFFYWLKTWIGFSKKAQATPASKDHEPPTP